MGRRRPSALFENKGERRFTPPDRGQLLDRVLVLDDAAKNLSTPGTSL
jgi:hypothetical protein